MASVRETLPDRLPDAADAEAEVVCVPSYSRWFSYKVISEYETRLLPEFFDGKCRGKNPKVYQYYRNSIVKRYRERYSSAVKSGSGGTITFTEVRKTLVGDVGSIRRVFDFLETWGLINYTSSPSMASVSINQTSTPKVDDLVANVSSPIAAAPANSDKSIRVNKKRTCGGCKSACSIACFSCEQYDLTLCARCYVRGNYRTGVSSADFKRIEISEENSREWSQKEMLRLLEAVSFFGDDWKKVAQHVTGRTDKECIMQFIKLPFGEELAGYTDLGEANTSSDNGGSLFPNKKIRLSALADASNPIMAQAAFLSALSGVEVAEAAARAALITLTDPKSLQDESVGANTLEKEELDAEQKVSRIIIQMKEIPEKIAHFEDLDLQMEKSWLQFEQLKNLLFVDQLNLLFKNSSEAKAVETNDEIF